MKKQVSAEVRIPKEQFQLSQEHANYGKKLRRHFVHLNEDNRLSMKFGYPPIADNAAAISHVTSKPEIYVKPLHAQLSDKLKILTIRKEPDSISRSDAKPDAQEQALSNDFTNTSLFIKENKNKTSDSGSHISNVHTAEGQINPGAIDNQSAETRDANDKESTTVNLSVLLERSYKYQEEDNLLEHHSVTKVAAAANSNSEDEEPDISRQEEEEALDPIMDTPMKDPETKTNMNRRVNDSKTLCSEICHRLRDMCATHGRTSKRVQEFCKIICQRFSQISGIIESYPAYTVGNEKNIVFVLKVKGKLSDIQQQLVVFDLDTIIKVSSSDICEDVVAITDDFRENDKDVERLKECILNNAEDLMQQHKYLNIIRGGSYKQIKGSKRDLCVVLYVHAKGFIPIDEEPFKKSYNGIHVKVREGRFTPYMNHADVVLNKVRMGCKIEGHQTGTLGVFIEHPSYGMCGITCAHVAISASEMEDCKSENGRLLWEKIHPSKKCIHQPSKLDGDLNQFGQIVEVIYKEGKGSETGIEIALIQIEKRHPDSGKFPTPRSNLVEPNYEFASGKTCGPTRFNTNNRCFKVGSVTDFTEGTIEMRAPNVVRTDKHTWDYDHQRITLYNQIFVRPIREAFAGFGDSGSPVFVKDEETGEPVCIGLVEGGLTAGGLVVVTPITKILEELGISQLKAFPQNVMQELQQIKSTLTVLQTQYEEILRHLTNRT